MRSVVTSDTDGHHYEVPDLPDGDIFVHAGDFMNSGVYPEEIISFNRWLTKLPMAPSRTAIHDSSMPRISTNSTSQQSPPESFGLSNSRNWRARICGRS